MRGRIGCFLIGILATTTGCEDPDREGIRKVGQLTHQRLRSTFPEVPLSCDGMREALRSGGPGSAVEVRVRTRLRSDKLLSELALEVRETEPGRVVLSGRVDGPQQKERALELARNTLDVEAVVDDLRIGEEQKSEQS